MKITEGGEHMHKTKKYEVEYTEDAYDTFYIIDLDTRTVLSRVDDPERIDEELEFYLKKHSNLDVVQALKYKS